MLKRTIVFTALAGLAFTVNIPAPAYAGVCLNHKHTGTGRGPTKGSAKKAARVKWQAVVIAHGHPARILWSQSKNQSSACSKKYYGYKCRVQATPCNIHQNLPATGGGYKQTRNVLGRCLDVAGGVNANGTNVQIFDCNGSKAQRWHFVTSNKTIRNVMGRCLQVGFSGNANGTNVEINYCNGTWNQQWTRTGRNEFRNVEGRCLDVAGGVNANGTNVQIFDCNRSKSQQWK